MPLYPPTAPRNTPTYAGAPNPAGATAPAQGGFLGAATAAATAATHRKVAAPAQADPNNVDQKVNDFYNSANQTSQDLANVPKNVDQGLVSNYFAQEDAPIQSQYFQQGDQVANYLSRQGMGSSQGVNVAASQGLSNNKAALEGQARLKATDLAMEKQRQSILDAFSAKAMGIQPELQNKGIDVNAFLQQMQLDNQMKMFQEQMDANSSAGWGQLAGVGISALPFLLRSDERLKKNIIRIEHEVLPGVPLASWEWKNGPKGRFYGVIAQDLEKVAPQYVHVHPCGYKMVDYSFLDHR
jgi:hypothetical protein